MHDISVPYIIIIFYIIYNYIILYYNYIVFTGVDTGCVCITILKSLRYSIILPYFNINILFTGIYLSIYQI